MSSRMVQRSCRILHSSDLHSMITTVFTLMVARVLELGLGLGSGLGVGLRGYCNRVGLGVTLDVLGLGVNLEVLGLGLGLGVDLDGDARGVALLRPLVIQIQAHLGYLVRVRVRVRGRGVNVGVR